MSLGKIHSFFCVSFRSFHSVGMRRKVPVVPDRVTSAHQFVVVGVAPSRSVARTTAITCVCLQLIPHRCLPCLSPGILCIAMLPITSSLSLCALPFFDTCRRLWCLPSHVWSVSSQTAQFTPFPSTFVFFLPVH
jgi:hypothetical protein